MKKFVHSLLFFLIPIIIIGAAIEVLTRGIPNSFVLKANYLDKHSNEVETLILGSSHTLYGVNPNYLKTKAFNASNVSQTIDLDLAFLEHYKDEFFNLKTVVLRLSYTTLFEQLKKTDESWRLKDYNIYFNLDIDKPLKTYSEVSSVKFETNLKRIYNYYFLKKPELNCNDLGWGTDANSSTIIDLEASGVFVAKKHTIKDTSLYTENVEILNAIVRFCKKRNIQLLLVTLPAYKSYTSHLNANQLYKTIKIGKEMANTYSNCNYYNLLENKEFKAEDFYDADHLNEIGAKKFSLLINTLLKR